MLLQCGDLIFLSSWLTSSTRFVAALCSILLCQDRSFLLFDLLVNLGASRGLVAVHLGW
jgi:hypothetical protein